MPPPPGDLPAPLAAFLPPTPLRSAASGRARRPDPRLARRVQQRPSMAAGPSARPPPPPPPRRSAPRGGGGGGGGGVAALAAGIVALAAATSGGGGGGVGMAALPLPPAARAEVAVAGSASAGGGGGGGGGVDAAMPLAASMVRGGSALDAAEAAMAAADAAVAAAEAATSAADAATVAADAAMAAAASVPAAAERAGVHARVATAAAVPEPTSVITPSGSAPDPTAVTVPSAGGLEPTAVARPDAAPGAAPAAVPTMVDSIPSRSPAPDYISPSLAPPPVTPAVATAPAPTSPAPDKEHALLEEVWSLIDRYYLTLRDAPAWADQRRKAASTPLGGSRTATYAAARRMLKTLGDPYTRLLTPDGMAALSKYDVTGLGLMLLPTKGGGADADAAAPPPVAAAAAANSGSKAVSGSSGSGGGSSDGAAAAPSRLYVAAPPPKDSPAGVAGLRRSDVIMAIDGKSTANMSAWEAATRMQGPAEGLLSISYARPPAVAPGATPALGAKASAAAPSADAAPSAAAPAPPPPDTPTTTVSLTRKFASASAVTSTLLPPAASLTAPIVGVVRLSEFNASAAADAGAAFQRLAAAGADAYVLDLRGNPGGVFEGALDLAGLLDGDGTPAATVVDKTGASETFTGHVVGYEAPVSPVAQEQTAPTGRRGGGLTGRALPANAVPTGAVAASAAVPPGRGVVVPLSAPLVVLLDDHSASSSEVLAGALRDNCRAVLAGGRSYGKGVIQGVFGLSDGAGLVVTVASYVTPRGDVIQERGLSPQLPLSAGLKERAGAALRGRPPPLEEKIDWARVREQLSLCAAGEEDVVGDGRGGGVGHTPWGGGGRAHGAF